MRENSCCACKLAMENSVQLQDFKDCQKEQMLEIISQLIEIRAKIYHLERQSEKPKGSKLEDLSEEEWDRLIQIVTDTYTSDILDVRSIILQRFNKLKNG